MIIINSPLQKGESLPPLQKGVYSAACIKDANVKHEVFVILPQSSLWANGNKLLQYFYPEGFKFLGGIRRKVAVRYNIVYVGKIRKTVWHTFADFGAIEKYHYLLCFGDDRRFDLRFRFESTGEAAFQREGGRSHYSRFYIQIIQKFPGGFAYRNEVVPRNVSP